MARFPIRTITCFLLAAATAIAADAPFVPALPSTTPGEALSHLRAAISGGADDQALGEAYDFVRRYPDDVSQDQINLAAGALHLRRGEAATALKLLLPIAKGNSRRLHTRALHLAGGALIVLGREFDVLKLIPAADPAGATDRWLALAQIWRAVALERLGRKEEAGELYRAIVASGQQSPIRAYALGAIGVDWDRQGKPERAQDALTRAEIEATRWKLDDLRDALALSRAHAASRAHRYEEASRQYREFIQKFPNSPLAGQAYYERGLALKRLGHKEEAIQSFENLLARAPNSAYAPDAHLQLGQLDTELGLTQRALFHYRQMGRSSQAKDADREALLLMAKVHYNAKRWSEAVPLYRRWLEAAAPDDPQTKDVEGLLLISLWSSNRNDPELEALAGKIPDHPLVAQIRWTRATAAYKNGDWDAAQTLLRRQIEADASSSNTPDARFYRAEALRQMSRAADAIDAYRRFLDAHPKDERVREARMRLGALLYQSGDSIGAAAVYGQVTGNDADAADAAYNRALALDKARKGGADAWESFADRFPKHPQASWAWWTAARLREEHDDPKAAADYARATGPQERTKALYALGRFEERLKRPSDAKAAYQKLAGETPKHDPARLAGLLRLSLLLELEDRPKSAAPLYKEILRYSEPHSSIHDTAQKRLTAL